jgi:pimeloyl-ACP methyl ester carboxylesterase
VIPKLLDALTLYALDLPGMGWSDITAGASYTETATRRLGAGRGWPHVLISLPETGHFAALERPEQVAEILPEAGN